MPTRWSGLPSAWRTDWPLKFTTVPPGRMVRVTPPLAPLVRLPIILPTPVI
jgi:hypothetical protein